MTPELAPRHSEQGRSRGRDSRPPVSTSLRAREAVPARRRIDSSPRNVGSPRGRRSADDRRPSTGASRGRAVADSKAHGCGGRPGRREILVATGVLIGQTVAGRSALRVPPSERIRLSSRPRPRKRLAADAAAAPPVEARPAITAARREGRRGRRPSTCRSSPRRPRPRPKAVDRHHARHTPKGPEADADGRSRTRARAPPRPWGRSGPPRDASDGRRRGMQIFPPIGTAGAVSAEPSAAPRPSTTPRAGR